MAATNPLGFFEAKLVAKERPKGFSTQVKFFNHDLIVFLVVW
jgi:hypothetical protein